MNRRLPRHRFRQALKANLPVRRRAPDVQVVTTWEWVVTYDAEGRCVWQGPLPAAEYSEFEGEPFGYIGRELDADTDLFAYRARHYDPTPGRWLSGDPLGFAAADTNIYRYVATDPPSP